MWPASTQLLEALVSDVQRRVPIPCDGDPCENAAVWLAWLRCCHETAHSCDDCLQAAREYFAAEGHDTVHQAHDLASPPMDWMPLS